MPEEVLDTKNEKVKDVELEKKDSLMQQLFKKLSEHKFFVALQKVVKKTKDAKAKSADNKKKKATAKKETAKSTQAKSASEKAKK